MNRLDVLPIQDEGFGARAAIEGDEIVAYLSGNGETPAARALQRFVDTVHAEAMRLQSTQVSVNLRRLDFMNSTCLKSLVTWLARVQELPQGRQYRIRFLSDPNKHWQKRSLAALSHFASGLVRVET